MQQPNGQLLWAASWFLVSKLILKWKSRNIWYLPLEEWLMCNRGTLVPVHSWGGLCQLHPIAELGLSLSLFRCHLWISLPCSGEKGQSSITLKGNVTWNSSITSQLWALRDPGSKCALHGAKPAVLWPCSGHGLRVPDLSRVWLCWTRLPPLAVGWERKEGLCCLGLAMLSISAPPCRTANSSYKE